MDFSSVSYRKTQNLQNGQSKMLFYIYMYRNFCFYEFGLTYLPHFGTDFAHSEFTDPLKAVTRSGIVNVCKGSTMPKRGLKALFPIPVLAFSAS